MKKEKDIILQDLDFLADDPFNKKLALVLKYKELLKADQFVITGSMALYYMGLQNFNSVKDIDIILVNPSEETRTLMEVLVKAHPPKIVSKYPVQEIYRFSDDGIDIDVFSIKTLITTKIQTTDGFLISPVPRLVEAKRSMNRLKDWLQLKKMALLIYDESKFQVFLNQKMSEV